MAPEETVPLDEALSLDETASLEDALREHENKVDLLLRQANRYVGALKTWKKACQVGHVANLQKAAAQAEELSGALPEVTAEAKGSWTFDIRAYLEGGAWRRELQATASERFGLRTLEDDDTLISSPVTVHAQPSRGSLSLGKVNWPAVRPKIVAAELKRLRDRTAAANSQEFIESLQGAFKHLEKADAKGHGVVKLRDIYNLFCLTPGYKRENPPAAFGQQIYSLHRSDIRITRGGCKLEFEGPSGNSKQRDVFAVIAEDGRPIRYYAIWFT